MCEWELAIVKMMSFWRHEFIDNGVQFCALPAAIMQFMIFHLDLV